jgi:hypothetical protein
MGDDKHSDANLLHTLLHIQETVRGVDIGLSLDSRDMLDDVIEQVRAKEKAARPKVGRRAAIEAQKARKKDAQT